MAKKKRKKSKMRSWEEVLAEQPANEEAAAAFGRLMDAEQILYDLWEERGEDTSSVAEVVSVPSTRTRTCGSRSSDAKVAAMGGHLELVAVFPDKALTLVREPGPPKPADAPE